MDYLRQDLRDALDEVNPEVARTSAAATAQKGSVGGIACSKCRSLPAPVSRLRYCGRCQAMPYCSMECAEADWSAHTRVCDTMRRARVRALAEHEAQGARGQDFHRRKRDTLSWFEEVPGLSNEMHLLAWKHRNESPLIRAFSTSQSDTEGSDVRVEMIPRSIWDQNLHFLDTYPELCEQLRQVYDHSAFCPNTRFVCTVSMRYSEDSTAFTVTTIREFRDDVVRGAAIVEALTATMRADRGSYDRVCLVGRKVAE